MSCLLDKKSIELLRAISRGGWATPADLVSPASQDMVDLEARIRALQDCGILGEFKPLPFLPALHGGLWGRYVLRLHNLDLDVAEHLERHISGLEESLHNAVFFTRRFPTTTFFCFSKTSEELKLILREAGVEEEPMKVLSYNFPFSANLSEDERLLLSIIDSTGEIFPTALARKMERASEWVDTKMRRLMLHSANPQGVAILRATIHWFRIDNFIHAHVLLPLEVSRRLDELCKGTKAWARLKWPPQSSETLAIEADFAGWGHFSEWKSLVELEGFPVAGFALAAENRIHGKGFQF